MARRSKKKFKNAPSRMAENCRCSEQSLAPVDEPAAAEPLLSVLVGDPLRAIARFLADEDLFRFRLACKTMRDHCDRPCASISRAAFLRTRSLAVYACDELPDFVLEDKARMLLLAARVGCVAVLAELMDVRGCGAVPVQSVSACRAAASCGQLEALVWLRGRGFGWGAGVCESAAGGGHLEVLRYAHEHGCPWDWRVAPSAPYSPGIHAYVETLWLADQHPPPLAHGE